MKPFIRIRPDASDPGWRLRLEADDGGIMLAEEQTFPERVEEPGAVVKFAKVSMWLDRDDLRWIVEEGARLLAQSEEPDSPRPTCNGRSGR